MTRMADDRPVGVSEIVGHWSFGAAFSAEARRVPPAHRFPADRRLQAFQKAARQAFILLSVNPPAWPTLTRPTRRRAGRLHGTAAQRSGGVPDGATVRRPVRPRA